MPKTLVPVLLLASAQGWAAISPSQLEVNLGPLPVDKYLATNNGLVSGCSASLTVRACFQYILASYSSQGVTGVRFQFGLGGGGAVRLFRRAVPRTPRG